MEIEEAEVRRPIGDHHLYSGLGERYSVTTHGAAVRMARRGRWKAVFTGLLTGLAYGSKGKYMISL